MSGRRPSNWNTSQAIADELRTLRAEVRRRGDERDRLREGLRGLVGQHPHSVYCVTVKCHCRPEVKRARSLLDGSGSQPPEH